ncbi:LLM class flavin-dependent oxidoreductase [Paenibacillus sp. GSMTC-2017]|uniref:LLM class flavin-dependent oxidoreductase n=1 Tax=Paenibacillus sp. GSMTC-2017 TaxID=2794350 RepID=UPI0018D66527|nr:LLM class flavin-dependent oxidoreductase [Paenibacillus sp. GSMTC-2017]MBH5317415.1 LLM class flavin-dependent oxidoreductase [Paenibacillus sp. GSMTC-2017]
MSTTKKQVHLNVFVRGTGHHSASWKHPLSHPESELTLEHYANFARIAERGLFDSLFLADNYAGTGRRLEPFTLFSALSVLTKHIGFIATVSTTYNDPYHVARQFASLDHISNGRAAWNIVTGASKEDAANFGRPEHPDVLTRYAIGDEFVEVVKQLWDSWESADSLGSSDEVENVESSNIHEIHFKGNHFNVKGPLNIPRPPQGYPVLVQAGSSEGGKELAAKTAEVIFTAQQTLGAAQQFYSDVKSRLAKYGRTQNQLLIMPGLSPIVADTEAEAKDIENELSELLDMKKALKQLSNRFTVDLSDYPLDGPVPLDKAKPSSEFTTGITSRHEVVLDAVRREKLTIRQMINRAAGGHGHVTYAGSVIQVADFIERWVQNNGSDGFNIMPHIFPSGLETFVDKVIPELQNRGIFRTSYEGTTLRDNLGLARPENTSKKAWWTKYDAPAVR